jgi:hypothetical protein
MSEHMLQAMELAWGRKLISTSSSGLDHLLNLSSWQIVSHEFSESPVFLREQSQV